jgi:hypothetical protein
MNMHIYREGRGEGLDEKDERESRRGEASRIEKGEDDMSQ